jgi:hypothetical protein
MLFGSTLLEVAIGIIFVFLLVSLLCSALNELIEAWLKYRARYLEQGIRLLLSDPGLADALFNHPLVKPLGENPSYIPARTFSLALWNIATTEAAKGQQAVAGVTQDVATIRALIGGLDEQKYGNIKASLLSLIDEAGNDIDKARANVEGWYNDAMDRVSGWYKRRTHVILVVIGLVAAFALNIDTIQITKALLYNDTLRSSVATAAQEYAKSHASQQGAAGDPDAAQAETKIKTITADINALGLPIGWNDGGFPPDAYGRFLKLLGLILTGLAVSQGAPFWFDLLNKFIVIRSTVKPREKSQQEGTKDKKPSSA